MGTLTPVLLLLTATFDELRCTKWLSVNFKTNIKSDDLRATRILFSIHTEITDKMPFL